MRVLNFRGSFLKPSKFTWALISQHGYGLAAADEFVEELSLRALICVASVVRGGGVWRLVSFARAAFFPGPSATRVHNISARRALAVCTPQSDPEHARVETRLFASSRTTSHHTGPHRTFTTTVFIHTLSIKCKINYIHIHRTVISISKLKANINQKYKK